MPEERPPSNVVAHMQLRAPRVALVVPVTSDWHRVAMHGIHLLTTAWGGAGFVVVPTHKGHVHPAVLAALREYDPDSVLAPPADLLTPKLADAVHRAQQTISAACANHRAPGGTAIAHPAFSELSDIWFPTGGTAGAGDVTPVAALSDARASGQAIGANPALSGSLVLAAASRWGLGKPPATGKVGVADLAKKSAVVRLSSGDQSAKGLDGVTTRDSLDGAYETEFARTLVGLEGIQSRGPQRSDCLVVVGDAPSDFALAMVWDRTYRGGIWVPDAWWSDRELRPYMTVGIDALIRQSSQQHKRVVFTSTSLDDADLTARAHDWRRRTTLLADKHLDDKWAVLTADALRFSRYWKAHYVLKGHPSHEWSTPVTTTGGAVGFTMLPPVPSIGARGLERIAQSACWHVDVGLRNHDVPVTTAVPEASLLVEDDDAGATRIRVSRTGVSYRALLADSVPEESLSQSLARPLLRFPSLISWADARAGTQDLSVRRSPAGDQAGAAAAVLGSGKALTDLIGSGILPALRAFNGGGRVINSEGYLDFSEICEVVAVKDVADVRARVDGLLKVGVLRRGLLTRCPECRHSTFVHVDDIGSTIRCPRCLADNAFDQQLWQTPVEEPTWFYDLHPTFRKLFQDNGEVALLLSHYLHAKSRRSYADAVQLEVLDGEGSAVSRPDLLALADRRLSLAFVASRGRLGGKKERVAVAREYVAAAQALQVDEVVLATTASRWKRGSVKAMKAALLEQVWSTGRVPALRIISGLGGEVSDVVG